jgi:signal transduction histidine kinase
MGVAGASADAPSGPGRWPHWAAVVSVGAVTAGAIFLNALAPSRPARSTFLLPVFFCFAWDSAWLTASAIAINFALAAFFCFGARAPDELLALGVAIIGTGLYVNERNRCKAARTALQKQLEQSKSLLNAAEVDKQVILESTPMAMFTVDRAGRILNANQAARDLFQLSELTADSDVKKYLPALGKVLRPGQASVVTRQMIETGGRTASGESFFAQMWLSPYETPSGRRISILVTDASEQLRDREELGLRQLMTNSRIVAAAVTHEIRNLCAAASIARSNLGKLPAIRESPDFGVLGTLIDGLQKLTSDELVTTTDEVFAGSDLQLIFEELQIILTSSLTENGIELTMELPLDLPKVQVSHSAILQVLLNLIQNSERALNSHHGPKKKIGVVAYELGPKVVIRITDTGPGIQAPDQLFRPLRPGATATGLGLYISRAILRTHGGELYYQQQESGCGFLIELAALTEVAEHAGD